MDAIDVTESVYPGFFATDRSEVATAFANTPLPSTSPKPEVQVEAAECEECEPFVFAEKPSEESLSTWDCTWETLYAIHGWERGKLLYKIAFWAVTIFSGFTLMGGIALSSYLYDRITSCLPALSDAIELTMFKQCLPISPKYTDPLDDLIPAKKMPVEPTPSEPCSFPTSPDPERLQRQSDILAGL